MLEGRISMEVIAEESSRVCSDQRIRDDSNSCELLVEAYQRIRALEAENQDLTAQLVNHTTQQQVNHLQREIHLLEEAIRERDLKIENLERISQKAIMDFVLIENQLNALRAEATPQRRHVTPIPSELSSPLSLSKINRPSQDYEVVPCEERVALQCAKELLREQEKLAFERSQGQWRGSELFTFDKENLHRSLKSPEPTRTLKNCFSQAEVHQLIKKVQRQEDYSKERQKLQHYHQYCSSIERKHSPNTAARKAPSALKKPTLAIKHPLPYSTHSTLKVQKSPICSEKWAETATTTGSFFTGANRLHFY